MPARQSEGQRKTMGRVMHEYAHVELKSGRSGKGGKVKSRRQAIAIALKEAGESKYASRGENKRNLARSKRKEATGRGLVYLVEESARHLGLDLSHATAIVQGFGNVGSNAARFLQEAGAKVIGVSDQTTGIYNPKGLAIDSLLRYVAEHRFLKGCPDGEALTNEQMLAFLQRQRPETLASVCTGALILAAAGVLDGKCATTRRVAVGNEDKAPLQLLQNYAGIEPHEAVVVDSGIVTGGGVSLAIDTTLYLIGRFYGNNARDEVARLIEYDRAYAANYAALGTLCVGARDIG